MYIYIYIIKFIKYYLHVYNLYIYHIYESLFIKNYYLLEIKV